MVNQLSRPTKGAGEYRIGREGVNGIFELSRENVTLSRKNQCSISQRAGRAGFGHSSDFSAGDSSTVWMKMQLSENNTTFFMFLSWPCEIVPTISRGLAESVSQKELHESGFVLLGRDKRPVCKWLAEDAAAFVEEDSLEIHLQRLSVGGFRKRFLF